MLVVVSIFAHVLAPVWPGEHPYAVHLIVRPSTLEDALVSPSVCALSADLIVVELANIAASVSPVELTIAVLFPVHKLALKHCAIWPLLPTKTVLIVSVELSDVPTPISMLVDALSACLTFSPDAVVAIAIRVNQTTWPTSLTFTPKALVAGAIGP